jgi:transcriptional regulator with XRE-family HTH domain
MATQAASTVPQLGEMLRHWRHERGKSQLDLSLDTGISQRHLSFVESGRSAPSRDFLSIVSDALNIPLRERNVLLLASGYAPIYSEQKMDAEQMAIVTQAIDRVLSRCRGQLQQKPTVGRDWPAHPRTGIRIHVPFVIDAIDGFVFWSATFLQVRYDSVIRFVVHI